MPHPDYKNSTRLIVAKPLTRSKSQPIVRESHRAAQVYLIRIGTTHKKAVAPASPLTHCPDVASLARKALCLSFISSRVAQTAAAF
jgi:hypothetical protein